MTLDLSPKTLREVEFREQLRGYHKDDVDDFLERVAAGLETLLDRLREANDRAVRLESRAVDRIDDDDTLKRTLILAQRTADLAIQEAQESAARTLAGAEDEAKGLLARAEARANEMLQQAETQLREDIDRLQAAREQLLAEVSQLGDWMDTERERLRSSLSAALAHIEDAIPVVATPPDPSPVEVPPAELRWNDAEPTASMKIAGLDDKPSGEGVTLSDPDGFVAEPAGEGPDRTAG
jgi:DivIVA domain-containing protein